MEGEFSEMYGFVLTPKTRVRCVFCSVYLPKANKCIEQHSDGAKHKENIILTSEHAIRFHNNELYCKLCKRSFTDESTYHHITKNNDHKSLRIVLDNLINGEYINIQKFLSTDLNEAFCEVCECDMACEFFVLECHINSLGHQAHAIERIKPWNGLFDCEDGEEVWCKVCDVFIENTIESIQSHIGDDDDHLWWINEIEDAIDNQDISIEDFLSNEQEINAFCNKCLMPIVCTPPNIDDHVHSIEHIFNLV